MQKKLFQVTLKVKWFTEASTDVEAENEAIHNFCLDEVPPCCTYDMQVEELVSVESLKADKTLITLTKVSELVQETDSPKLLKMLADLTQAQVCGNEEEMFLSAEIQKEIYGKLVKANG